MQFYNKNRITQFIFRALAVIITCCYILGPAHKQVNSFLHAVAHNLEMPNYVIQHNDFSYKDYQKVTATNKNQANQKLGHSHHFLSFINHIFEFSTPDDKNKTGESAARDLKIKKHITSRKAHIVFKNCNKSDFPKFWTLIATCKPGHLLQLYKPPQSQVVTYPIS